LKIATNYCRLFLLAQKNILHELQEFPRIAQIILPAAKYFVTNFHELFFATDYADCHRLPFEDIKTF